MDYEELYGQIYNIFHHEPVIGNEGEEYYETPPQDRLTAEFGLDTSYWKPFEYGAGSALVRRATVDDNDLSSVIQAQQAPFELFFGTIRLLGDSIILYHNEDPRHGPYRYYPAILMSAWASFEAFVRVSSELLVKTARALPNSIQLALLESEDGIEKNGVIRSRRKFRPLLDRYWWLLKFGYGWNMIVGVAYGKWGTQHLRSETNWSITKSLICPLLAQLNCGSTLNQFFCSSLVLPNKSESA